MNVSLFTFNAADPLTKRTADFLHWASVKYPGQFIGPNLVVKAIMGYGHTPRLDNDEVKRLRSRYGGIRETLRRIHKRDLLVEAGVGIRGSIDDADVLVNAMPKAMRKLDSAKVGVVKTEALIDMKNVPQTAVLAPYRAWHKESVSPILKLIASSDFERRLLPPALTKPEEAK